MKQTVILLSTSLCHSLVRHISIQQIPKATRHAFTTVTTPACGSCALPSHKAHARTATSTSARAADAPANTQSQRSVATAALSHASPSGVAFPRSVQYFELLLRINRFTRMNSSPITHPLIRFVGNSACCASDHHRYKSQLP
jgi:hypothetical protein